MGGRTLDCPSCFGQKQLLLHEIQPVMLSCEFLSIPSKFRFNFDIPCLQVPNNGSRIWMRYINKIVALTYDCWQSPTKLICAPVFGAADVGPALTSFTGAEMDIFSSVGIIAEKWTDVPITSFP